MSSPQHRDSLADSLADALDPLESHHASDPSAPLPLSTQILRFTLTGVLSAVVDLGLTELLYLGLEWPFWLAKSLGFIAGTTTAYLINRRWTFKAEPSRARFLAVMALYAVMFGVQVGIATALLHVLTGFGWSAEVASVAAFVAGQGVATVTNFIVQRTVIFTLM